MSEMRGHRRARRRLPKGCSSLNLDLIVDRVGGQMQWELGGGCGRRTRGGGGPDTRVGQMGHHNRRQQTASPSAHALYGPVPSSHPGARHAAHASPFRRRRRSHRSPRHPHRRPARRTVAVIRTLVTCCYYVPATSRRILTDSQQDAPRTPSAPLAGRLGRRRQRYASMGPLSTEPLFRPPPASAPVTHDGAHVVRNT
jgi:hypothetical protein